MKMFKLTYNILPAFFLMIFVSGCEKFVTIDELKDKLLADKVFENNSTANSAIVGMYKSVRQSFPTFMTTNAMVSDEIVPYLGAATSTFVTNNLQVNGTLPWSSFYGFIYAANSALEKLSISRGIPDVNKLQYQGEAKFVRAFAHFYLVNFFGDVPLVLTTDVQTNSNISRTPTAEVYSQIVSDLTDAAELLPTDYSHAGGERVRANRWAAKALLARVYLYLGKYDLAESLADEVIQQPLYALLTTPVGIWAKNNTETIWQFANTPTESNNAAASFIYTSAPTYKLTDFLLNAFEPGDLRKETWVRTQDYQGAPVSIPFKMTSRTANPPEYYTVIRLAELYLIRAEAKAMREDYEGCRDDVNEIRAKHGGLLNPVSAPASKEAAIGMILQERRVELFTESAHRWFDLKRTGKIDEVMLEEKPTTWNSWAALYPIPLTEMQRNPNMKRQNPGYEQQ